MKIMDLNSFLEEMDNDYDDVNMIVSEFTNSIEKQLPQMLKIFKDGDYNTLSREAHSIKGGARNIMAPGLEFAATDLEVSATNKDPIMSEKYINKLEVEFIRFKRFISENLFINH